jgi:hypothetical protein
MARVKVDEIVGSLDNEFKRALADTMNHFAPEVRCDRNEVFRFFQRRIYQHCSSWEDVPDRYVQN